MTKATIPTETPWGAAQSQRELADGIVLIETEGHGGIWLSPERNAQIPMSVKEKTFCKEGLEGWYEEDCDAEIVYKHFGLKR